MRAFMSEEAIYQIHKFHQDSQRVDYSLTPLIFKDLAFWLLQGSCVLAASRDPGSAGPPCTTTLDDVRQLLDYFDSRSTVMMHTL